MVLLAQRHPRDCPGTRRSSWRDRRLSHSLCDRPMSQSRPQTRVLLQLWRLPNPRELRSFPTIAVVRSVAQRSKLPKARVADADGAESMRGPLPSPFERRRSTRHSRDVRGRSDSSAASWSVVVQQVKHKKAGAVPQPTNGDLPLLDPVDDDLRARVSRE